MAREHVISHVDHGCELQGTSEKDMNPGHESCLIGKGTRKKSPMPLAERLRPQTIEEFVGQEELFAKGAALRNLIEEDRVPYG
jgi:hypothetical protein